MSAIVKYVVTPFIGHMFYSKKETLLYDNRVVLATALRRSALYIKHANL